MFENLLYTMKIISKYIEHYLIKKRNQCIYVSIENTIFLFDYLFDCYSLTIDVWYK